MKYFSLVLPFVVFWFVFNLLSIFLGLGFILKSKNIVESLNFVLKDPLFWLSLKNSFLYTLVVIPVQVFSFVVAYLIYKLSDKWVNFFRVIFYLPVVVPIASIGFVFKMMFNDEGVVNDFLFRLMGFKIPFLSNYYYAMLVAFLLTLWKGLGYYVMIYLSGFYSISKEIIESCIMDGMNEFQKLRYVYVPMMKGTIYFASFLSMLSAFKVFAEIFIVTEGGPGTSTFTLMMYIYFRAFYSFDLGSSIVASFILSFIVIVMSLFIFRKQIESARLN